MYAVCCVCKLYIKKGGVLASKGGAKTAQQTICEYLEYSIVGELMCRNECLFYDDVCIFSSV